MILSQAELRGRVAKGDIAFSPQLEDGQWGEASIDLRLGYKFTILKTIENIRVSVADGLGALADAMLWDEIDLRDAPDIGGMNNSYLIRPGEFVLARTHEEVKVPRDLIARVEGRSTYARVGLSMHQTAPWIQPGWEGQIVLEIMNSGSLAIDLTPMTDQPCQITFFNLTSELPAGEAYGAKPGDAYQHQQHVFVPPN